MKRLLVALSLLLAAPAAAMPSPTVQEAVWLQPTAMDQAQNAVIAALADQVLAAGIVTPTPPIEPPAAEPAPLPEMLGWVISLAIVAALAAVGWAARRAAGWVRVKTGLDTEVLLLSLAESAVSLAEERARQWAKNNGKMESSSKMAMALDFLRDRMKEMGVPEMAENKLRKILESRLGATRGSEPPPPLRVA